MSVIHASRYDINEAACPILPVDIPGTSLGLHATCLYTQYVPVYEWPRGAWGPGGVTRLARITTGVWLGIERGPGASWRVVNPDVWYAEGYGWCQNDDATVAGAR